MSTQPRARSPLFFFVFMAFSACQPEVREPAEPHFGHTTHVRAGIHCTRCHEGQRTATTADAVHLPDSASCNACHEAVHPNAPDRDCMKCHTDRDTAAVLKAVGESLIFNHSAHLKRNGPDCVGCHRGVFEGQAGALPRMAECATCHQAWIETVACDKCHQNLWAQPLVPISHQAHGADFVRRHSLVAQAEPARCGQCHAQSFCAECHDGNAPLNPEVMWADRPDRTFIHRPGYLERHAPEARLEGPTCLGCHGVDQCRDCHALAGRGLGGLSPHPTGWASPGPGPNLHATAARRDLLECAACHGGSGGDLCADCHGVGRPGGSPHGGRTPLGNPLSDRPCTACHGGRR